MGFPLTKTIQRFTWGTPVNFPSWKPPIAHGESRERWAPTSQVLTTFEGSFALGLRPDVVSKGTLPRGDIGPGRASGSAGEKKETAKIGYLGLTNIM